MVAKRGKSSFAVIGAKWVPLQYQEVGPQRQARVLVLGPCLECALPVRVLQ
ncbi:hypothetical protein FHT15_003796 [Xanthomonas campestris]